jgi:DNA-binding response OmpR family regulator
MLTARGSEVDRIVGLELGADDYVVKPFSSAEVVARVKAVLRRTGTTAVAAPPAAPLEVGGLSVDLRTRRATAPGGELELTRREFDLLAALARRGDAVVTRDQLFDEVWGGPWYGSPKVLDVQISALRRKLSDAGGPGIETVRGVGYRMAA